MSLLSPTLLVAAAVLVTMSVTVLYRAYAGPTTQDRVVALNVVGTHAVVVIVLIAAAYGLHDIIDIAIVYALLNFLLAIAISKFSMDRGEVL